MDAIALSSPVSVYWATGYDFPTFLRGVFEAGMVAVVPKDQRAPVLLVMDSFSYHWAFSHVHEDPSTVSVYQFTTPPPEGEEYIYPGINMSVINQADGPLKAGEPLMLRDRKQEPLSGLAQRNRERTVREVERNGVGKHLLESLQKALVEWSLSDARIGVELGRTSELWRMLAATTPDVKLLEAQRACALIRAVKSSEELTLIRHAARGNAEAALSACKSVRAGATYRDLRTTYFSEASRRSLIPGWMIVDHTTTVNYEDSFRDGQVFYIDAVASFGNYYGDYGRTVFVGEPSRHMKRHADAIRFLWDALRETLKPGIRFSEIQAMGSKILRRGGYDTNVRVTPHSIGLLHTDAAGVGDLVCEPGMVVSVDCPVLDVGIGGSAHIEDLTLITSDGHEMLNDIGDQVIQV